MNLAENLLLLLVSATAGALNSVAGGGSFLTFPLLLFLGVSPVAANATNTVGLWPATIAGAVAYRKEFGKVRSAGLYTLAAVSFVGGLAGAILLLKTSDDMFVRLVPYLLLAATMLFSLGPRFNAWLKSSRGTGGAKVSVGLVAALQVVIAIYGGYFGGGVSILILAALSLIGMTEIHPMNAAKVALSSVINGISVVAFIIAGAVHWKVAVVMILGAVLGGYLGAHIARKIAPPRVRQFILAVAWTMTAVFFVKSFHFETAGRASSSTAGSTVIATVKQATSPSTATRPNR